MDHLLSMEKESQRNLAYEKNKNQKVVKARKLLKVRFLFSFEGLGD